MLSNTIRRNCKNLFRRNFSFEAVADSSYNKFRSAYLKNYEALKEQKNSPEGDELIETEKITKVYTHPADNEFNPIHFGGGCVETTFFDFVGPEQVSPHYENFTMSRKWAIGTVAGTLGINMLGGIVDLHWIFVSALMPFFYWMATSYWFLEGKKSLMVPLLVRFYSKIAFHEMELVKTYWVDNMREKVK